MPTDGGRDYESLIQDPRFLALMSKRSKIRWSLASSLSLVYFAYGLVGHYYPDVMAKSFFGSSLPWVMVVGFLIIVLSILMSILYIRVINRIEKEHGGMVGPGA